MARIYLDTNILLHAKPLQDIKWEERETPPITLVITTTNIRELDRQKDQHPKKHLRDRARKALQRIEAALTQPTIRSQVTIEIHHHAPSIAYDSYHLDPTHADDTIIANALQAQQDHPEDHVILYTHDVGPRLTAARLGITAKELPAEDNLPPQQDEAEKENERLKRELHDLRTAAPQLRLTINNETHTATVQTLAPTPPAPDEQHLTTAARTARAALPQYPTPTPTDPTAIYVPVRHFLNLESLGMFDHNAIPESEYDRYQRDVAAYEAEYRAYLAAHHDALTERARSLALTFTLHNDGGKPGEEIRITITAPTTVTITEYARPVPRPPTAPTPPRSNGTLHAALLQMAISGHDSPYPLFNPLPDFHPAQTGPDIEDCEISWWVRRLRHTYHHDLGTLYLTLVDPGTPFTLTYHLHATNAAKPVTGEILIKPRVTDSADDIGTGAEQ